MAGNFTTDTPVVSSHSAAYNCTVQMCVTFNLEQDECNCLQDRHWYAFFCSSMITFCTFLLIVLLWRIFEWVCCQSKGTVALKGQKTPDQNNEEVKADIGWMTEAKDWAGELISGQTTTGRILVRSLVYNTEEIIKDSFKSHEVKLYLLLIVRIYCVYAHDM